MKKLVTFLFLVGFLYVNKQSLFAQEQSLSKAELAEIETLKKSNEIFTEVDVEASFNGGIEKAYDWMLANIRYPLTEKNKNIEGKNLVKFVVEKDGTITNVEVVNGKQNENFSNESKRLIASMPRWVPAKKKGVSVRSYYLFPVLFRKAMIKN